MRITVYFGTGGVGKTSVAAATALVRARAGNKCLVLTTDPAMRLRTALRLQERILEQRVPLHPESAGELWAALLDVRATLDEAVRQHATPGDADRILRHSIYATIADSLSGMQELMAVERIDQLRRRGFEDIVVDTPPSRHALEILDKPVIFAEFAGSSWVKMIGRTYKIAESLGMMALGRKALDIYSRVEGLLGAKLVREILDFYSLFLPIAEGYADRAQKTVALLKDPAITEFRLVSTPQKAFRDARYFSDALGKRGFRMSRLYVNRVWDRQPAKQITTALGSEVLDWYRSVQTAQVQEIERLRAEFGAAVEIRTLAEMDRDVDGLDSLEQMARTLGEG